MGSTRNSGGPGDTNAVFDQATCHLSVAAHVPAAKKIVRRIADVLRATGDNGDDHYKHMWNEGWAVGLDVSSYPSVGAAFVRGLTTRTDGSVGWACRK